VSGSYTITRNGPTTTVSGADGTDTLTEVEGLQFSDTIITSGNVYIWSFLSNGQTIAFDPLVNSLFFDQPFISANDLSVSFSFGGNTGFTVSGKTVTVQTDIRTLGLTPGGSPNVVFANGSVLLTGDNSTSTAGDADPNTLNGSSGADRLFGFGGNDTMLGGPGNDAFVISPAPFGDDLIEGGPGTDTFQYGNSIATAATIDLGLGTAINAGGNSTFSSIETVFGSSANDTLIGGDAAHAVDAFGNNIGERFRGRGGNDSITGGAGDGFFTTSDYSDNDNTGTATMRAPAA
jgi:Ca2+-binding RTX toxin-like protein